MNVPEGAVLIDGMLIDVDSGEILAFEGPDKLFAVATRRAWAKEQEDKWKGIKGIYDRTLLSPIHGLAEGRQLFGDIECSVRSRQVRELDGGKLVADLRARYSLHPTSPWATFVASASGFRTSKPKDERAWLTPALREILDAASSFYETHWIETTVRRDEAPEPAYGARPGKPRSPKSR